MAKTRHFLSDYFKNKTQTFKIKHSRTLRLIKNLYKPPKRKHQRLLVLTFCSFEPFNRILI
jgi:hypothetical protein